MSGKGGFTAMTERRQGIPGAECLFVAGSDGDPGVRRGGRPKVLGNNDLYRLLGIREIPRVLLRPNTPDAANLPDVRSCRLIVNQISDPDQNPNALEMLSRLLRDFDGRVVNDPRHILLSSRDEMAKQLAGTPGLCVPKVARCPAGGVEETIESIERAGLSFPVILRDVGTHGGKIIGLFATMDELQRAAPPTGERIATEFVDFRSADGLYRKFRVFFIGGVIVLRHMLVSDEWNIHARDRMRFMLNRPDLRDEERRRLERPRDAFDPQVAAALIAVRGRVELDYFGMDFGIAPDGRVVLFEANATMNFLPFPSIPEFSYSARCLPAARLACGAMLPELSALIRGDHSMAGAN